MKREDRPVKGPYTFDGLSIRDSENKRIAFMGWGKERGCSMLVSNEEQAALAKIMVVALNEYGGYSKEGK